MHTLRVNGRPANAHVIVLAPRWPSAGPACSGTDNCVRRGYIRGVLERDAAGHLDRAVCEVDHPVLVSRAGAVTGGRGGTPFALNRITAGGEVAVVTRSALVVLNTMAIVWGVQLVAHVYGGTRDHGV